MNLFNYNPKGKGQANSMAATIQGIAYYFSYSTCIAVLADGKLSYARNEWGPTTGKHINWAKAAGGFQDSEQVNASDLACEGITI